MWVSNPASNERDADRALSPERATSGGEPLLKRRRTKIVATLGPASSEAATVRELLAAGVDVVRLNFSHDHESHAAAYRHVREAADALERPVAVLADLCGPKIRVGRLAGGQIELRAGETVTVTTRDVVGAPGLVPSQYAGAAAGRGAGQPPAAGRRPHGAPRRRGGGR